MAHESVRQPPYYSRQQALQKGLAVRMDAGEVLRRQSRSYKIFTDTEHYVFEHARVTYSIVN